MDEEKLQRSIELRKEIKTLTEKIEHVRGPAFRIGVYYEGEFLPMILKPETVESAKAELIRHLELELTDLQEQFDTL